MRSAGVCEQELFVLQVIDDPCDGLFIHYLGTYLGRQFRKGHDQE
jgi:hypothetical protein